MKHRRLTRRTTAIERLEARLPFSVGDAVADYQFTTHGLNGAVELYSRDTHAGSLASDISSPFSLGSTGNGQPPRGLLLGSSFNATTEQSAASASNHYFQFTITPVAGESLDLSLLTLQLRRNDPNSKDTYAIYFDETPDSRGDNFRSILDIGRYVSEDRFETVEVSLRNRPEMTGVTAPISFRVYVWGTLGTSDLRLDNLRVHETAGGLRGSTYAYYGDSGQLIRPLDEQGNRVADFSSAGYRYGGERLPEVDALFTESRTVNVAPGAGDDASRIQTAINQVSALTPLASGFRGLVQLAPGEYQIASQLTITTGGVVLRGAGDGEDLAQNTTLRATGTSTRSLIVVGSGADPSGAASTRRSITDKYVPVGATSVSIDDASGFSVGQELLIERPSTANWITDIGMDQIPPKTNGTTGLNQWQAGDNEVVYERVITRIEGNRLFLNAPLMNSFDERYGGGFVSRLNDPRIKNVGIESIRGDSDFTSPTDEAHASTFIQVRSARDVWVRNVTGRHFVYATVWADRESKAVTVQDVRSLDPVSVITGGRRYAFNIEGQFILMRDLYSEEGRHDFVNNVSERNHGPNVFLSGVAVNTHENSGPHQRWSTGTLYDNLTVDDEFEAIDGGNAGTGHGWRGANMVFWNVAAPGLRMQNSPTAQNWFLGATGDFVSDNRSGIHEAANQDSRDARIDFTDAANPLNSLYVAQRNEADRLSGFKRLEYVIGDYDLGVANATGTVDLATGDGAWTAAVDAATSATLVGAMDGSDVNGVTALTFAPALVTGEAVYSALVSLGVREVDDASTASVWLDSTEDRRLLSDYGVRPEFTMGRTRVATIELSGADMLKLADGRLNLAVTDAVVDWVNVQLVVGARPALAGDYNNDGAVDAADYSVWRDHLGAAGLPSGELASPGVVDAQDFALWRANYGQTAAASGLLSDTPSEAVLGGAWIDAAVAQGAFTQSLDEAPQVAPVASDVSSDSAKILLLQTTLDAVYGDEGEPGSIVTSSSEPQRFNDGDSEANPPALGEAFASSYLS